MQLFNYRLFAIKVDSYVDAIKYLIDAIQVMQKRNPNCLYHVFIHKVNLE